MKEIDDNTIVRRHSNLVFSKIDDEVIMMSIKKGEYYGLDNIGSRVWEIIEKPIAFKKLIDILRNEFEVSEELCRSDVMSFLEELVYKELVVIE
jgi:hypothetical protein